MRADTWANAIARSDRSSGRRCVGDERSWVIRGHHITITGAGVECGAAWRCRIYQDRRAGRVQPRVEPLSHESQFATSAEPSRFQLARRGLPADSCQVAADEMST